MPSFTRLFPAATLTDAFTDMVAADDAFAAALVRQFGVRHSGDSRYDDQAHNSATAAARQRYHDATANYLRMRADLRGEASNG